MVHRPQHDPLIHDSDASPHVFTDVTSSRQGRKSKVKHREDLEEEFGLGGSVRDNEGEAAEHGIFYDDSSYDYMQHMRDLGGGGNATWIEASHDVKGKAKAKQSLEDALSEVSLDDDARSLGGQSYGGQSFAGGWNTRKENGNRYQGQQDIPDELAGFQPDMDPRLREVLEALDDEEYVDDDEDIFSELAGKGGEEVPREEWEDAPFEDDDDGWESDTTEKPSKEFRDSGEDESFATDSDPPLQPPQHQTAGIPPEDALSEQEIPAPATEDQDFLASFAKPKGSSVKPPLPRLAKAQKPSDLASSSKLTSSTQFGRRKKRKGALTSESGFSMTSSSLARTEPLNLLDSRFDKIAESYMEDDPYDDMDDNASLASGVSGMTGLSRASGMSRGSAWGGSQASEAPSLMPANFDSIMDDFLGGTDGDKRYRPMRKAGIQGRWAKDQGLKQLDEIRQGLGPARVRGR